MSRPHIVAIGGTSRTPSSTARALERVLAHAEAAGARTTLLTGAAIDLPNFEPGMGGDAERVATLLAAVRDADGVVIGSPGYHGSFSGLVKNALDHLELTARDPRPYLSDLPVGIVAVAAGWQAAVSTLAGLRGVVHALRGWPTPLGVAINSGADEDAVAHADAQLAQMAGQMLAFARARTGD